MRCIKSKSKDFLLNQTFIEAVSKHITVDYKNDGQPAKDSYKKIPSIENTLKFITEKDNRFKAQIKQVINYTAYYGEMVLLDITPKNIMVLKDMIQKKELKLGNRKIDNYIISNDFYEKFKQEENEINQFLDDLKKNELTNENNDQVYRIQIIHNEF